MLLMITRLLFIVNGELVECKPGEILKTDKLVIKRKLND